ncbi:MAG TPA: oligosaccharide flippase family protein [Candidatus Paceibacterota bacterium]|nr:oligosaccharide flippase family protein [Candidatus Paceibacterota bacterium]
MTSATNGFMVLIGLASSVIIARYLGPEKKGIYSVLMAFVSFLLYLGNYGITNALCYYSASGKIKEKELFQHAFMLSALSSLSIILIGGFLYFAIPKFHNINISYITLALLFLVTSMNIFNNYFINIFLGQKKINFVNFTSLARNLSELFFIYFLIITLKLNILGAIYAYIIASLMLFLIIYQKSYKFLKFNTIENNYKNLIKILSFGLKAYLSNLFLYINLYLDLFLIYYFLGATSTGIYSIASTLIRQFGFLPVAINQIILPFSVKDIKNSRSKILNNSITILIIFYLIVFIMFYFYGQSIITLFFGDQFSDSNNPLRILLLSMLPLGLWRIFSGQIYGLNLPEKNILSSGLAALINIAMNITLIPRLGIIGAAYSSVISYTIMCAVSYIQISKNRKR